MKRGWTLLVAMTLMAGCAGKPMQTPDRARSAPLATEPAGTISIVPLTKPDLRISDGSIIERPWQATVGDYPNGSVVALPTYYHNLDAMPTRPDWQSAFVDLGLFAWDTISLPVHMVLTPPWKGQVYGGAEQVKPVPSMEQTQ